MRLNEVTQLTESELTETISLTNESGYKTNDLVKVAMTEQAGNWSEPMTGAQLDELMESWSK